MKIWTIKKIKELFLNEFEDVYLLNVDTFELDFFKKSDFFDIVILEYYEGFRNFVNNYLYKGFDGLIIFCDFRKGTFSFSPSLKTIIVDVNKLGVDNTKGLIKFLVNLYKSRIKNFDFYLSKETNFVDVEEHDRICEKDKIIDKLNFCFKNRLNIIMAITILDEGRKVTARGTGYIKDINDSFLVIEKVKPSLYLDRVRLDEPITIVFSDKDFFYESQCKVRNKSSELIFIEIPEFLLIERRKYVRVEPNFKNPVKIYLHIPGQENEINDCMEISITGASFVSQRDLTLKGIYIFGVKTPYDDRFIICEGIIRNKLPIDDKFRYGVEFSFSEKDIDIIANYIRKREVEILELLKENN